MTTPEDLKAAALGLETTSRELEAALKELGDTALRIKAQRDLLAGALKNILTVQLPGYMANGVHNESEAHKLARAALARAGV